MCKLICPLCNEVIKTGQVRQVWWMSDIDKRIAHTGCITAYEKGVVKGKSVVNEDLEFAYKRSKVLADMLGIPVHESPEVTGTILGMVRGSVEKLIAERDLFKKETLALSIYAVKVQSSIERIIDSGADGCCKYCDIKTDIAKEALEI
jgi:hypothetical protein